MSRSSATCDGSKRRMASDVAGLQPWLAPWAARLVRAAQAGWPTVRVTSTLRTPGQQARLYRRYLAGLSPYPAAPAGRSLHERGRAFDVDGPTDALRWM